MQIKKEPKPLRKLKKHKELFYKQDFKCALCGGDITGEMHEYEEWIMRVMRGKKFEEGEKRRREINLNIDHIVPLGRGGKDKKRNKQLTHATCNSAKGSLDGTELELIGNRLLRKTFNLFNDSA